MSSPNPSPKSQSQVANPSLKSKIQIPEERDWDWGWKYNPTGHHPNTPPITFLNLKCQSSDDLPWASLSFHDIWPSMTFYHLLRPLWPIKTWSKVRISQTQAQINSPSNPRLDLIDSKSSIHQYNNITKWSLIIKEDTESVGHQSVKQRRFAEWASENRRNIDKFKAKRAGLPFC